MHLYRKSDQWKCSGRHLNRKSALGGLFVNDNCLHSAPKPSLMKTVFTLLIFFFVHLLTHKIKTKQEHSIVALVLMVKL